MDTMNHIIQEMNRFFYTHQTKSIAFRLYYLKKLKKVILQHQKEIVLSLQRDFKKPAFETYTTEIFTTISELNFAIKHLKTWAKPKIASGSLPVIGGKTVIYKEPYGVCTLFSPYNYPFCLAFIPLIGALAAGNCVVVKPSEHTPYTNKVIRKIIKEVFPPYYVSVIEGPAKTAKALLNEPIDYIFFTGGIQTAKSVMKQAAEHLIPVTLELGGKSPAIVDETANLKLAAKRIIWGKFLNGGQTCIAPDYVLVHEKIANQLLKEMVKLLKHYYKNPMHQMAHMINESQYVRVLQLIQEDKIYYGGHFDTDHLFIEPTLLYPVHGGDLCMQEEIFGPVLPIIPYKCTEDAIRFVQRQPKPLACYLFGQNKCTLKKYLAQLSFGGGCINDTILHITNPKVPFGGVGYSGMGAYHGYYSYQTFSHEKSIFISSAHEMPLRFPDKKYALKLIQKMIR